MRRAAALLLVLVCAAGAAHAAGDPVVRVTIDGKPPYLVGQPVRIVVDVLVPNYFMSGVEIPAMDMPGAVVSRPDESSEHLTESIGGQSYAGIRQSFTVTPQREGELTLPPAQLAFRYAAEPGRATAASVTLPPRKFSAQLPAGAKTEDGALPVAKVTVRQTLDRDLKDLKAGDALVRTVETFAENTQAMMIPPPGFTAPDGVRVYDKDPVLADETGPRGGFIGGRRTDRVTYVFEKAGDYALPAVEIGWYNPATDRRETARAPEIKVSVAPNPQAQPEIAPEAAPEDAPQTAPSHWKRWLFWATADVAAFFILVWLVRRIVPPVRARLAARRRAREESEAAYFARVERACAANDAVAAYRTFLDWRRRSGWSPDAAEPSREIARLEETLYARRDGHAAWRGAALAAALSAARDARRSRRAIAASSALPELNP